MPIVSAATVTELVRVLAHPKFSLTDDEQHDLLGEYLPFAESVDVADPPPSVPAPPDPDDRKFLELAVTAGAAVVITGDPHLLALNGSIEPPIITPAETHRRLS